MNYILGGNFNRSGNTSNAMDKFFTDRLMNDQLLQILFRSLEANIGSIEALLREKVVGPVRSSLYDVGELYGLVKAMNSERPYEDEDTDSNDSDDDDDE